jgi:hypothetical protein
MEADGRADAFAHDRELTEQPTTAATPQTPQDQLGPEAFNRLLEQLRELNEYFTYYLAAKVDGIKLSLQKTVMWAVLGVLGLLVVAAVIVTSTVLLLTGLAGGLGILFDHQPWLGNLTVGVLVLVVLGVAVYFGCSQLTTGFWKRTVTKYERYQARQRAAFGYTVSDKAAAAGPKS